jgi:hypothetical protein
VCPFICYASSKNGSQFALCLPGWKAGETTPQLWRLFLPRSVEGASLGLVRARSRFALSQMTLLLSFERCKTLMCILL